MVISCLTWHLVLISSCTRVFWLTPRASRVSLQVTDAAAGGVDDECVCVPGWWWTGVWDSDQHWLQCSSGRQCAQVSDQPAPALTQHRQHQGATHWGHSTLSTVCVYHKIIDILNHQCLWVTRIVSADAAQHISSSLVFRQNTNNIRFSATGAQLLSHLQPVQSLTPLHQDLYQHVE